MDKKACARRIGEILNAYFPSPAVPLKHQDPYTLLIAVLLSAQCTDARVNSITPHLFALAHTPEQMVQLSVAKIQETIRPCGLSLTKAKAIWELSKILIEKHQGIVPASFEELEELPGVGHKTASVVMAQAFNIPAFPVDTHILRCAKRWGLSMGKTPAHVEKDLKELFPKTDWIKVHLQIIYFARKFCQARQHVHDVCPICSTLSLTN
ncbi:endonuclease III [Parachlamydia sp. AcF125]|uniref:endonuclease III n=1 Tax=Parachlamydia sp. AcF125 TaxID=2795736 RepID=UPI001BCA096F|nr:Endonuclease III [Parachlamydia sp. AcF125]